MFKDLKSKIKELAQIAVESAEVNLGSKQGKAKKKMAVDYIVNNLPVPIIFKPVIASVLSNFIDEAVEFAVSFMKTKSEEKGD